MPRIVEQPFVIAGEPVRLVEWDWQDDPEYADAEREGIVDVLQVTYSDLPDPLRGWVGDIFQLEDGSWAAPGHDMVYPTAADAALALVLAEEEFMASLSDEDIAKLERMYLASLTPGTKPIGNTARAWHGGKRKPSVPFWASAAKPVENTQLGYTVMYGKTRETARDGKRRLEYAHEIYATAPTLESAKKALRHAKRRGFTAWIEKDGEFVPVKGAMRRPRPE